jgi:hypothetical protein
VKFVAIFGLSLVVALYTLYEWPKINPEQKKEKIAFISLSAAGWVLAVLLLLYPEMPSHTRIIKIIYAPLGKLLEK